MPAPKVCKNTPSAARIASRHAALVGQSMQDADGIPLRYPSVLIRTQPDYGESNALLPRGRNDEMEQAVAFLEGLGQKFSSDLGARSSGNKPERTMTADQTASPLDGMTKARVLTLLNRLLLPHTKGLFRDQSWAPIGAIRNALEVHNIPAQPLDGSGRYEKEPGGNVDVRKVWSYVVPFKNQNGRDDKVYIRIVASGSGPVASPLDVYDVVAYAS